MIEADDFSQKHPRPDFEIAGVPNDWLRAIRKWATGEPGIEAIYLFGSRAKGCFKPESDIDLALLLSGKNENPEKPYWKHNHERIEAEMKSLVPVAVDIFPFNYFRGADYVPALYQHGIRIYFAN